MCFEPPRIPKHRLLDDRDYSSPLFQKRRGQSRLLRWSLVVATALITLIAIAETSRASESTLPHSSPLESGAGRLFIRDDNGSALPALHLGSEVAFNINGMVIHTRLSQTFRNPDPQQWAEGIYVFPLPETAAISRMEMRIGERVIIGEIKEKAEAKRQYQQAKKAGKRVALVEQERPNLFTQNVANIGPGEEVTVTLEYQDTVRYDNGDFSFRFPMTITPRFMPGGGDPLAIPNRQQLADSDLDDSQESVSLKHNNGGEVLRATQVILDNTRPWGWASPTSAVPDAHRISPPQIPGSQLAHSAQTPAQKSHRLQLSVSLDAGLPLQKISSAYHDLVIEKQKQQHFITTRERHLPMDRDFELRWQPVANQAPSAAAFTETLSASNAENLDAESLEHYALLMLLPPAQKAHETMARDVIYIIDTSGSMGGNSIRQAKQSLALALQRLQPGDRFNVIEFNSSHRALFGQSQPLNTRNQQLAQDFVTRLQAGGGTNMAPALNMALSSSASEQHLRQVVFITDGSVGNESQLFSLIHQKLGNARLFTVGIGSAPNSFFMRKAAQFGRGTFTTIGDEAEVGEKMSILFNKLESPVLRNLKIQWPTNMAAEVWPQQLPDLYSGEPLTIKAKLSSLDKPQQVTVSGELAGQSWQQTLTLAASTKITEPSNGISKLWAREKIAALLDEKVRGKAETEIKPQVLQLALQHQLLSPYTSFIAEDKTPARPVEQSVDSQLVANRTPHGQKTLVYPKTAAGVSLHLMLGLMALLGWCVQRRLKRPTLERAEQ